MKAFISLLLGAVLIAAVAGAIVGVGRLGGQVTTMGWVALATGTVVSLALAAGLMALMFHSARSGYDDRAAADPAAPDLSDGDAD